MLQVLIHLIQFLKNILLLVDVPTSLNNLKTKVDEVDVGKLKTVPIDFTYLSDVVNNKVVKNTDLTH